MENLNIRSCRLHRTLPLCKFLRWSRDPRPRFQGGGLIAPPPPPPSFSSYQNSPVYLGLNILHFRAAARTRKHAKTCCFFYKSCHNFRTNNALKLGIPDSETSYFRDYFYVQNHDYYWICHMQSHTFALKCTFWDFFSMVKSKTWMIFDIFQAFAHL